MRKVVRISKEGQKFEITQTDGTYSVETKDTLGKTYKRDGMTFREAGNWVWNMSDNHTIADYVCQRMCSKFNKTFA